LYIISNKIFINYDLIYIYKKKKKDLFKRTYSKGLIQILTN